MVWSVILCSRSAPRGESDGPARRREGAERAGEGRREAAEGRAEGRLPPANPPGDAFGLSASLCGRRGRRENAAGD